MPSLESDPVNETELTTYLSSSGIPWHLHNGILRWAIHGVQPGGYLTAVLTGDLFGAAAKADIECNVTLALTANWIRLNLPAGCFGSDKVLETWPMFLRASQRQKET